MKAAPFSNKKLEKPKRRGQVCVECFVFGENGKERERVMERKKRKKSFDMDYERREVPISLIDADSAMEDWDKKELRTRATYFLLNGVPEFSVNRIDGAWADVDLASNSAKVLLKDPKLEKQIKMAIANNDFLVTGFTVAEKA